MFIKLLYKQHLLDISSLQFLLMIIITKAIPIYILQNHQINWKNDLIILLLVITVYNLYLWLFKKTNIFEIYDETEKSIANHENRTPLLASVLTNR
jgi:cytosine/uracil/thiamine/allantoin permease